MKYYIGADLGTSALKLLLVDSNGKIHKKLTKEYSVNYPHPGWSEQSAEEWWKVFLQAVPELIADVNSNDIKAIGIAGQMHGLVILDENDEVIRPVILWNDSRTEKETEYLNCSIGKDKLTSFTANIAFAGFTAPKILWLKENEPDSFKKIKKIMLPKDYLNYMLTGVHSCDFSDASGMLLLDVKNKKWSKEMLDICQIKEEQMPLLFESYEIIGKIKKDISEKLNLSADTVVIAGAGDNAAAAIGTGTTGNEKCNISLGTSGTVFISSQSFSVDDNNSLHAFAHADGGYHLMGCMLSAASCHKWICKSVFKQEDYTLLEKEIPEDYLGKNELFFLPYLMGERSPLNDTNATGVFIGLRPDTERWQMLLAVFEGVSFAIRDNVEIARKLGLNIQESTLCGGGAKSKLWRKVLSNVLGIRLNIPLSEEGPGYGVALLAIAGTQKNDDIKNGLQEFVKITESIEPEKNLTSLYEDKYNKFKKIYPSIKKLYKELKE